MGLTARLGKEREGKRENGGGGQGLALSNGKGRVVLTKWRGGTRCGELSLGVCKSQVV